MSLPNEGKVLPVPAMPLQDRDKRFAAAIASALRNALGDTRRAVKSVMSWTGANERTVKNWLAGVSGPSGEHLIELVRKSDAVAEAFLTIAGRRDIVDAKRLINAHRRLAEMLELVDALRVDRTEPKAISLGVRVADGDAEKHPDPLNDPVDDPVNDPAEELNVRQRWFLRQVMRGGSVKAIDLRRRWAVSEKTAKRDIATLKNRGLIIFVGAFKTGSYRPVAR
jgi:hypothetical protein